MLSCSLLTEFPTITPVALPSIDTSNSYSCKCRPQTLASVNPHNKASVRSATLGCSAAKGTKSSSMADPQTSARWCCCSAAGQNAAFMLP